MSETFAPPVLDSELPDDTRWAVVGTLDVPRSRATRTAPARSRPTSTVTVVGPRGQNAYELAVLGGFTGTMAEWLESLEGTPGLDGAPGATGLAGAGFNYIHTQDYPSTTWTINHNLGGKPNIALVDNEGNEFDGDVFYNNLNTITASFGTVISGYAYLS